MTDGEVWHQQRPTTSDPFRNIEKIIDKTATKRVLREPCTWAKTNRIEVYTIGYEVTNDDANDLLSIKRWIIPLFKNSITLEMTGRNMGREFSALLHWIFVGKPLSA